MAKPTVADYGKWHIRKQETRQDLLDSRTAHLRNLATSYGWEPHHINAVKVVDDGTGHRVHIDPALKEEVLNKNYGMPGVPHASAIAALHYGLGGPA
jgi:hypothetical protein